VHVDRAPADPNQTVAYELDLEVVVPGKTTVFTIDARDRLVPRIKTGGEPFTDTVTAPYNRHLDASRNDNNDGAATYLIRVAETEKDV
jgi:hypothetical protein